MRRILFYLGILILVLVSTAGPASASIPGFSISKSSSKDTVYPGETITFTITMTSSGLFDEEGLHVQDDWLGVPGLPNNGLPFTGSGDFSCEWNGGTNPVVCLFGKVGPDESKTVSFPFTIDTSASPGTYENYAFIHEATDLDTTDSITIIPKPLIPPSANAGPDRTVIINEVVQFDGSSSMDPDGTIVSYVWNFGDQKSGSGVKVVHIYSTKGLYPVTLTVTDNDGMVGSDGAVITVITSGEASQDLRKVVDDLGLPSGIENALMAKLDAALKSITAGKYGPAKNQLQAFINQVNALRGKSLTNVQADALIQYAQRIMKSIT